MFQHDSGNEAQDVGNVQGVGVTGGGMEVEEGIPDSRGLRGLET